MIVLLVLINLHAVRYNEGIVSSGPRDYQALGTEPSVRKS